MYDDEEETSDQQQFRYGAPYSNMPTRKDETHNGKQGHYTGRCGHCGGMTTMLTAATIAVVFG